MTAEYTAAAIPTLLAGLGECIRVALAGTLGGLPARLCTSHFGAIAWDGCDCGQLILSVNRVYGSRTFPAEAAETADEQQCGVPLAVADITIAIQRCVPTVDDNLNPPSCAALAAAAAVWHADVYAIRQSVICCLRDLADGDQIEEWRLGASTATGPEGACAGSDTPLLVGFNACLCPPGI